MKLRTQLILAFLLLAVVPLGAITLYSYQSSTRALRRTVESESARMAEEMNHRMAAVTSNLEERIDRLETLPFPEARAAKAGRVEGPDPLLVGRMIVALGDAAEFIEEFEFTHAPEPPGAPEATPGGTAPGAGAHPDVRPPAPPVIIALPRAVAEMVKDPKLGQFMKFAGAMIPPEEAERIGKELEEKLGQSGQEIVHAIKEKLLAEAEAKGLAPGKGLAPAKEKPGSKTAVPAVISLRQEFGCSLKRNGRTVGHLKAKVSADRVLREVLSQTRREQGEIPFAVDTAGNLFTPDPDDAPILRGLARAASRKDEGGPPKEIQVARGEAGDRDGGGDRGQEAKFRVGLRPDENWVVVTREDPATGLVFGLAHPVGEALGEIRRASARNLGAGLGLAALALFGIVPISRRMTHNLSDLTKAAGELAAGRLDTQVAVRSRDELGQLAAAFNRMARDLAANQERLVEQERLRKELELCRKIQTELLPKRPLSYPFAEVQGLSIPAHELGGDFFNYFDLPGGEVALLMGDVSGKGVPAALLMANLQATIRVCIPLESDLAAFAERLDREVDASTPAEVYLTLFLGVLDPGRRELRYVNAGHESPFLFRRDGRLERLESTGRPIGLMPGGGFCERRVALEAGDRLFLYTDGLVDAEDGSGAEFGAGRLEALLAREGAADPAALLARVERAYQDHRGGTEAADDATLLVLKVGEWMASRDRTTARPLPEAQPGPPPVATV